MEGKVSLDPFDIDTGEAGLTGLLKLVQGGVCAVHIGEVVFVMV
jgi:hypothetical protein